MRTLNGPRGRKCAAASVHEGADAFDVVRMSRDQNVQVIGQTDQPAIEHPMRRSRKRKPIADDVRPVRLHGANMSGSDLGTTATIDQPESSDRTALTIGPQHRSAKCSIAHDPRERDRQPLSGLIEDKGSLLFRKPAGDVRVIASRQEWLRIVEAEGENTVEVGR